MHVDKQMHAGMQTHRHANARTHARMHTRTAQTNSTTHRVDACALKLSQCSDAEIAQDLTRHAVPEGDVHRAPTAHARPRVNDGALEQAGRLRKTY
jgi:hypothetical protein